MFYRSRVLTAGPRDRKAWGISASLAPPGRMPGGQRIPAPMTLAPVALPPRPPDRRPLRTCPYLLADPARRFRADVPAVLRCRRVPSPGGIGGLALTG
jgi:hypothetical protein